jgi:hypothetical protein
VRLSRTRLNEGLAAGDTIADKKAAIEEYFRVVAAAMNSQSIDPVSKSLMKTKLGDITGMSSRDVDRQLGRLMNRQNSYAVKDQQVVSHEVNNDIWAKAQREILEVIVNEPWYCEDLAGHIKAEDFSGEVYREIATAAFESYANDEKSQIVQVLMRIESTEGGRVAVMLGEQGEKKGNYKQRIEDALKTIDSYKIESERKQLKHGLDGEDNERLLKIQNMLGKNKIVRPMTPTNTNGVN